MFDKSSCLKTKKDSMKRIQIGTILCGLVLITLSGCGRIITWQKNTFYQGEPVEQFDKIPQSYIRSLYLYDQLSTVCLFDALWLSDDVRSAYVSTHALKTGKGKEFRSNFLRRQLEENKHFITFYLLSSTPKLDEKDAPWSLSLRVKNQLHTPLEVKVRDLSQEYVVFFGRKYNNFKTVYEVKFNALTTEEKPILDDTVSEMSLCIRSLFKEGVLTWKLPHAQRVIGVSA